MSNDSLVEKRLDYYPLNPNRNCEIMKFLRQYMRGSYFPELLRLLLKKTGQEITLDTPIAILDEFFSARTANALLNDGVETVGDLASKTELELLRTPNTGSRCVKEVKEALASIGLSLKERN